MGQTSEELFQQILAQQQANSRWNSPQNLLSMATLGLNGIAGFAGGSAQGRANEQDAQQQAYQRAQDAYLRRMQGRSGLASVIRGQMDDRTSAATGFADRSPLGAEQDWTRQNAQLRGLSQAAENFRPSAPTDPNILRSYSPGPNILGAFTTPDYRASISPEATERSIAERRKALSFINPDYQFGSSSAYGLPGSTDSEVELNRLGIAGDRLSRENQLYQLLTAQMQEASQPLYGEQVPGAQGAGAPEPERKKGGFWRTLGRIGLAAAPIIAAPFTGGASLALIGAGAGAASAALDGGGLRGALLGGAIGGATAGLGGGAAGAGAQRVAGESAQQAIQRAILNPRALASLTPWRP
jgi:hypothetical protein